MDHVATQVSAKALARRSLRAVDGGETHSGSRFYPLVGGGFPPKNRIYPYSNLSTGGPSISQQSGFCCFFRRGSARGAGCVSTLVNGGFKVVRNEFLPGHPV